MFSKVIQTTKSGMTQKTSTLTILGSMGSVIRFDYFAYAYNFMNIVLEKKENKVVLWSYMISAIDVQKITNVNAFKSLIDLQYHDLDLGAKEKLLKLIYDGHLSSKKPLFDDSIFIKIRTKTPAIVDKREPNGRVDFRFQQSGSIDRKINLSS